MIQAHRLRALGYTFGLLLVLCPNLFALNPALDVSQYAHTSWTIRDGFFKSVIYTIAQTPDGYLWLGTGFGLLRFDGVRAVPWVPPGAEDLADTTIRSLLATRDGTLWIGTDAGVVSWTGAKLTRYPELNPYRIEALFEDREGTVWAGGRAVPNGALCAIKSGKAQCYGRDGSLGEGVFSMYEDSKGKLWAGAASGLWRWKPGAPVHSFVLDLKRPFTMYGINEGPDGQLVVAGREGLVNTKGEPYPIPGTKPFVPERLLRDRDSALWLGTGDGGLLHLHSGRTDVFSRLDGLSADTIQSIFEDREGNIWVSTAAGLDRFREFAIRTVSREQGLAGFVWSVLAGREGSVWMAGTEGLNRWKDGNVTVFRNTNGLPDDGTRSLFQDDAGRILVSTGHGLVSFDNGRFASPIAVPGTQRYVFASGAPGNLWISGNESLMRLVENRVVEAIPWSQLGAQEAAVAMIPGVEPGGIWLGFRLGRGVIYFQGGQIRQSYRAADGLGAGAVYGLKLDQDGALWAGTASGLSLIEHDRVTTLTSKNGLPCNTIHLLMDDDDRSTWLYTACGLVRLEQTELEAWKSDPNRTVHPTVFDNSDGVLLRSTLAGGYTPRISKSPDGKLWFLPGDGRVSIIDPRHLPSNKLPPPVHIESIMADDKPYELKPGIRLPAGVRSLRIEYTALSLVAPEKTHFKYRLEGQNPNWHEVINERQATYTNLPPRQYRFRVIASNNSGVWNEEGSTLDFSIAPAYYQTSWFLALCGIASLAALYGIYRLRLYQVSREFNMQMEGRVGERLRIARDLHDTLLQSFHGLLLRFQTAHSLLAERPDAARKELADAIEFAANAITESRDAVQALRSSTVITNDLAIAIRTIGEELAAANPASEHRPNFWVDVEGESRDLHPILRDEVYRIAAEALRNAFAHAMAKNVEVQIRYEPKKFSLHVRDDGKGIDSEILQDSAREGHYGLSGMYERAKVAGGKLTIWSERNAGTEIELTIPGATAYSGSSKVNWFIRKFSSRRFGSGASH